MSIFFTSEKNQTFFQDSSPNKRFSFQAQRKNSLSCFRVLLVIPEKLGCLVYFL
ncbi:hypothetical protein D931_00114 [Enterococcus faecium 13.SD.W.09]|nr:hypothetical protein D931_00114 [Enterococcus faecium 13.SD.W.09]